MGALLVISLLAGAGPSPQKPLSRHAPYAVRVALDRVEHCAVAPAREGQVFLFERRPPRFESLVSTPRSFRDQPPQQQPVEQRATPPFNAAGTSRRR